MVRARDEGELREENRKEYQREVGGGVRDVDQGRDVCLQER